MSLLLQVKQKGALCRRHQLHLRRQYQIQGCRLHKVTGKEHCFDSSGWERLFDISTLYLIDTGCVSAGRAYISNGLTVKTSFRVRDQCLLQSQSQRRPQRSGKGLLQRPEPRVASASQSSLTASSGFPTIAESLGQKRSPPLKAAPSSKSTTTPASQTEKSQVAAAKGPPISQGWCVKHDTSGIISFKDTRGVRTSESTESTCCPGGH